MEVDPWDIAPYTQGAEVGVILPQLGAAAAEDELLVDEEFELACPTNIKVEKAVVLQVTVLAPVSTLQVESSLQLLPFQR